MAPGESRKFGETVSSANNLQSIPAMRSSTRRVARWRPPSVRWKATTRCGAMTDRASGHASRPFTCPNPVPSTNTSSWRERFFRDQPEFPWLAPGDPESIEAFLQERGFLADGQKVLACTAAGAGNMNLTLRIETSRGSLVLKQSRPWVEKYEHIRAPWDRDAAERNFYESAAQISDLAPRIPKLLGSDPSAHVLLIEDLVGASDLTTLYRN